MSMKTVNDIRSEFLGYFNKNGHEIVKSSPLVPQNDPTLMFTNAGMVQFKNVFTGNETRPYTRATTSQKCVRAGGKHNDLENVGYTARHHTFFEMMGNFSFGDYFKEDAIRYGWELATKIFGLPADRLLVTVYHTDDEAANLWKKIAGLPDERIIRIATSDNFWAMGDTGPCGPCTEIFYDHGDHIQGGPPGSPDEDGDRFIEIWNIVFMQYEQIDKETRIDLPNPSIDTGMGLERMAAIMQNGHSNYDIDLFQDIINHSADLTSQSADITSHKVIADHLRSSSFLIADGVLPSNEGRGYVLRRIMRRAMRHAHLLGTKEPLMHRLFPTLLSSMGEAYPELGRAKSLITETMKMEESKFKKTLDRGLKLLEDETENLKEGDSLQGETAFKLYDTYGFPLDLTQDALRERNIDVDTDGFNTCMKKQKEAARASWSGSGDTATDKIWFDIEEKFGATDFLGYKTEKAEGQILAIVKDGKQIDKIQKGDHAFIVTNQTPFYGEAGGQAGDIGEILSPEGNAIVTDTQKKLGKLHVHLVNVANGELSTNQDIALNIDSNRRLAIKANHSATHLLHAALRKIVGDHVTQKGSLVNSERLRFDFSQPVALTEEQRKEIENLVNNEIRANTDIVTRLMGQEEAVESGAMALFGEKYDEEVRVLSMGTTNENGKSFSVELCGGTHATRTGDIGLLRITSESAVSSGVRRIEAVTGAGALSYIDKQQEIISESAKILKTSPADLSDRVKAISDERKKMEAEITKLRKEIATGGTGSSSDIKEISGIKFTAKILSDFPAKDLKPMADDLKTQIGSGVIALIAVNDGKASIVVGVTKDLTANIDAVDLVRVGSEALGGKGGGGRPDMAQAGGPNGNAANDAVSAIEGKLA